MVPAPPAGARSSATRNGPPRGAAPQLAARAGPRRGCSAMRRRPAPPDARRPGVTCIGTGPSSAVACARSSASRSSGTPAMDPGAARARHEIEQRLHLAQDPVAGRLDVADAGPRLPGERPGGAVEQQLGIAQDRVQRGPQVMAQARPVRCGAGACGPCWRGARQRRRRSDRRPARHGGPFVRWAFAGWSMARRNRRLLRSPGAPRCCVAGLWPPAAAQRKGLELTEP